MHPNLRRFILYVALQENIVQEAFFASREIQEWKNDLMDVDYFS